ncbi:Trehalose-6-phosphate phosphatase [Euzebya pacifica]|uniref:Trehalose 6-phosphate phosphatase n=1 Tax=Euzebya pacifica TaxID=1608957 RepID=A0A346XX95_9ACTN|nr:trehalose-phosphatase [Euzebya pacifica]AXV06842.1 Trehalose-6-phosphate phosphatase [Euzebya pacifica]
MTIDWPAGPLDRACLVLDFDGTLAPIVSDPATSAMPDSTRTVLASLVGRVGRLAIVSGRPAGFLAERVGVDGAELVGLYGLERVVDGSVEPDPRVAPYLDALAAAKVAMGEEVARWEGAELEDKGRAFAVHWRRAADRDAAAVALEAMARRVAGELAVEDGKMVVELRPPVAADKGTAVALLADGFDDVCFAGDDLGDLPAFAEVRSRGGLAVAVDHGEETDPRVRAAADVVVDGTAGFADWLAARLA